MAQKDKLGVSDAEAERSRKRSKSPSLKKKNGVSSSSETSPPPSPQYAEKQPLLSLTEDTDSGIKDNDIFLLPSSDYSIMVLLTIVAVAVRLFRIHQPSSVVFDEVHFGGFATKYIKGRFFMDVHPPLAKLLITLAGWMAGFDGSFDFKEIGKDYLEPGVPYVAMRLLPAICGIAVVPTIFLTMKAAGCSTAAAILAAGLIIFDNALATQSRLILLDAPLVIFTAVTGLAWTCFLNVHEQGPSQAFSANWWFWLACTGLGLGATASVKWVGLFTIAWVGSLTILQLWTLLGDTKNISASTWIKHFAARAWCLIGIPVTFYMAMFAIHFTCLRNPGEGDGFMSSEFQSTLNSKGMNDVPADVAFGSKVSIRHWNTQGGYLHSHASMYPTGSKQQQITLYPHKDENNLWFLENQTYPEGGAGLTGFEEMDPQWIQDGSIIKLYHISTDRRLHSHDHRPPVTEADWQNEVSAYGHKGFEGDANDMFRVEIVKHLSDGPVAKERVRTIQTKFKLVHTMSGCVLFSHKVKLPAWGFEQQEVTCAKGATLPNSIWYIESNEHPKLGANAERVNYKKPGFFGKFWELQKVMWKTNAGLVESHAWDSRPESWPILRRGINFWGKDHRQVYLIGNPLIWWTSTAAIGLYALFKGLAVLRWQRGYRDYTITNFRRFDYEVGVAVLAWAFHYFPFFLMQRQLFLHHYLPALYFAVVVLCQVFDYVFFRIKAFGLKRIPLAGWTVAVVFLTLSAVVYGLYSPLVYGNTWTKSSCRQVKLFDTWDWDCNTFPDKYDDYSKFASKKVAQATPSAPVAAAPPAQQQQQQQPIVHQAAAQQPLVQQPIQEEAKQPEPEIDNAMITPQAKPGNLLVGTEEHVEYRDQDGNILDPEQVKALEGQVSFETKYETRYRMIDEDGNELPGDYPVEQAAVPENPEAVELETVVIEVDQDGNTIQAGENTKVQTVVVEVDEVPEDAEKAQTVVVEVEVDQDGNTIQFNDNGEPIKTETVYVEEEASPSQAAVDAEEAPVKQSGEYPPGFDPEIHELVEEVKTVYVDDYGNPLPDSEQAGYEEPKGTGDAPEAIETIVEAEANTTSEEESEKEAEIS